MSLNLNDMALFVEVARAKSFRRAAEVLGIPNPTVSRRVSALEQAIGLRLLHRTTRKVELTEAGALYYENCKRIINEANLIHEQLDEMLNQPSGTLRATFPVDLAIAYLAPLIAEFSERYPKIDFDLDLTPRHVDLVSEPFDVAIRTGKPEDSQLIARPIANLPTYLYAAPAYLEQTSLLTNPADLEQHQCLSMLKSTSWTLHNQKDEIKVNINSQRFGLNSIGLMRELAVLGKGIILIPEKLVENEVNNGKLRRILTDWSGAAVPVYAITETRLLPAKVRCFIDFLREHMQ